MARNAENLKKLIIIPAYNEAENIERTIRDVKEHAPGFDYVIINDCSRDDTLDILRKNNFHYLNLPVNLGIGGAVQTGYRYAYYHGYDLAVQFDGDGQHNAAYLQAMADELVAADANMVIGSRFIKKEGFQSSGMRRAGIRHFTRLIRLLTRKTITDPTSGLRIVDRKLMDLFQADYPKDYPEPESTVMVLSKGYKVQEIPVIMNEREGGVSSISLLNGIYYMIKVSLAILFARIHK